MRLESGNSPMLATERLLVVTVDGANFGHALQRLCNIAPLHSSKYCVSYNLALRKGSAEAQVMWYLKGQDPAVAWPDIIVTPSSHITVLQKGIRLASLYHAI